MNTSKIAPLLMMASLPAIAETVNFDADPVGIAPLGWTAGVTGRGAYRWTVEADARAPSKPNVLKQSGQGDFPWCVKNDPQISDGFVEMKFKSISGKEDQAGGIVWRWKDGDNYYVARANALEDNVSLYYTQHGRRITLKYVDAPVAKDRWHTLRVEFAGKRIRVALDGKVYIDGDRERAASFLNAKRWVVGREERHRDALASGDLVLVFVAVTSEFVGRAKLETAFLDPIPVDPAASGPAVGGVLLADADAWTSGVHHWAY